MIDAAVEPRSRSTQQRRAQAPLGLIVFVGGAATLGAEIAAARLMAPFFGASTIVWANTIAIVLLALSAGYWLGGRLADRRPDRGSLCRAILAGACLLALVPFVAQPFLSVSVVALDEIAAGAFIGSLVGVLVLVAAPVLVLGTVSPWAIRLAVARVEDAGSTAGRLYALSTLGSLAGVFAAALALVPFVGTQRTFIAFALLLALVAAPGLPPRLWVVPLAVAGLLAVPPGATKPHGEGRVIHERETTQQYARVVELPDGERRLELNEGQAYHSIHRPDSALTGGVWDGYLVAPLAVLGRPPRSVAILGNGAGTTMHAYERYFPATRIDGVEIDGELTEIGRRWFGLRERDGVRVISADARPFLRAADRRYEAIFVDAYRQPYIPFYLTTREFFALASRRLAAHGVIVVNVGHPEGSDALERVLAAGLRERFGTVQRYPLLKRNTLLVAGRPAPSAERLTAAARGLAPELRRLARDAAAVAAPGLSGASAYSDDRAPVEWLIDESIVQHARGER